MSLLVKNNTNAPGSVHTSTPVHDITASTASLSSSSDPPGYGDANTFLRLVFVMLSRIGFLLIQLGSIPVENVYRIIFLNIFEIGNAIIWYIGFGHMITFGDETIKGVLGYSKNFTDIKQLDDGIMGMSAVLLGSAQISCFLVARIHLIPSFFVTLLYCGFFQPMLGHWIWNEEGWMRKFEIFDTQVSVKDYGGDLVIHLSSCIFGTMGAIFLGRRLIKLKDLDERSLSREYSGHTVVGYALIIIGYVAFNLPAPAYEAIKMPQNYIATIVLNMFVAFGTGMFFTILLNMCIFRRIFNYWSIIRCLQGGIAGIISIAAAVDIYTFIESFAIAAVSSIFFFLFSILIHSTSLEDNCNMIASYMISSIIGTMACPLITQKENFAGSNRTIHILWQLICLGVVMGCSIIFSWFIFLCFACCKLLRSKEETVNHRRAVSLAKYLRKKGCLIRLFMIDSKTDHITPGEIDRKKYLQEQ